MMVMPKIAAQEILIRMSNNQSNEMVQDDMVIETNEARVSCNGGGGALGHPQIWLTMGADNSVTCPYCSRHFVLTDKSA